MCLLRRAARETRGRAVPASRVRANMSAEREQRKNTVVIAIVSGYLHFHP
jgi:hypothetical protein